MKKLFLLLIVLSSALSSFAQTLTKYIVTDQFGYLPDAKKIAVIRDPQVGFDAGEAFTPGTHYALVNVNTGENVFTAGPVSWNAGATDASSGDKAWHFDFSSVTEKGRYYVLDVDKNVRSFEFEISPVAYNDVLKQAMRFFFYQRAGFEKNAQYAGTGWADGASHIGPLQDKNCRLFSDKNNSATEKDLSGGWYDAGDYNKYTNWTANYVVEMMKSYLEKPDAWADNYNIPESGNAIPDLLDEARWGIDFLLRMQQSDGGVLCIVGESHASPPSTATGQSLYGPATTSASFNTAAAFALSSKVYRSLSMTSYADTLVARAIKAWNWAITNPNVIFNNNSAENSSLGVGAGNQEEDDYTRSMSKLESASFLFEATGITGYRDYFDNNYQSAHLFTYNSFAYPFEVRNQDILLYYTQITGATAPVINNIKSVYNNAMLNNADNFPAYNTKKDPYLAQLGAYTWGSNGIKSAQGNMFFDMITYGINSSKNTDARFAAMNYIHYLHGVNPLNMIYLSNMYQHGGENCVNEFYHSWFCNGSAKWDRVGVSLYGPPPGFLTGGPNPGYNWDGCCPSGCWSPENNAVCLSESLSPPKGQPSQKSYKDFNTSWPLNSWEVTENSCGYQVNYIRLLSKFVTAAMDCNGDVNGTAYLDSCKICSGGNTGRVAETIPCNCQAYKRKSTVSPSVCDHFTSPSGKYEWTISGTYHDTIPGMDGCDSIITFVLTVYKTSGSTLHATACDRYPSPSGRYTWTSAGIYTDTIPNSVGCDSIVTVDLDLRHSSQAEQFVTACSSFVSPGGSYIWTASGIYTETIANTSGCDSTITINLTINNTDTTVSISDNTLTANATGAAYRWMNCGAGFSPIDNATMQAFTPVASGEYAVEVTQFDCVDTSSCHEMDITGILLNTFGKNLITYPNPSRGKFVVVLPEVCRLTEVEVNNLAGQTVKKVLFYGKKKLDFSLNEPPGMYYLIIRSDQQQEAVLKIFLE